MQGVIQSIETRDGKFGKYTNVSIDGSKITAYKSLHNIAMTLSVGDAVDYAYEVKGEYKNFTALSKAASGAAPTGNTDVLRGSRPPEFITRDESVLVSYAKDMMVAHPDMTPGQAVDAVMELVSRVKKAVKENPTS